MIIRSQWVNGEHICGVQFPWQFSFQIAAAVVVKPKKEAEIVRGKNSDSGGNFFEIRRVRYRRLSSSVNLCSASVEASKAEFD